MFFSHFALVLLFSIVLEHADGAGGCGGLLGRSFNRRLWVYTPLCSCERKNAQNAHCRRFALVLLFRGFSEDRKVRGALPEVGGRLGSRPFGRSGAPTVIGPADGHFGMWVCFRSFAQWGKCFLLNGIGWSCLKG